MSDFRYHCGECLKTYIGPRLTAVMSCNCTPPRAMTGHPYVVKAPPLSAELRESLDIKKATKVRQELCERWGVANKSHKTHGSNFSGSQTLAQLIQNIVEPVTADAERGRVRDLVVAAYKYDIDTMCMVD